MKALIDGDIICYRSAASAEKDDQEIALIRASRTLQDILSVTDASDVAIYLSGTANFRKEIYPEYKANRLKLPKPKHLNAVKEFLILQWGAEVTDGYEADDALGIEAGPDRVVCSIDKDLRQVPGTHYNFVTGVFDTVDELEGWRSFYYQLILGDRGDNVPGFDGKMRVKWPGFLCPIKASLDSCKTETELYQVVKEVFAKTGGDETLLRNGRLLYIWRKPNDQWQPPVANLSEEKQGEAEKSESTTTTPEVITRSTERGTMKRSTDGFPVRGRKRGTLSRRRSRGS